MNCLLYSVDNFSVSNTAFLMVELETLDHSASLSFLSDSLSKGETGDKFYFIFALL